MKRPWHKANPVLLEEIESTVDAYADLRLVEENQTILVRGTFPVLDDRGEVLDRYKSRFASPSTTRTPYPMCTRRLAGFPEPSIATSILLVAGAALSLMRIGSSKLANNPFAPF